MKRRTILTLSCLLAGLSVGTAFAQSRNESIDSITVTATRVPVALHSTARIVTLLDSMTIASAPAETDNDLLKYAQPGGRPAGRNQYHRPADGA